MPSDAPDAAAGADDGGGAGRTRSGWGGCGIWAAAFFVVIIGGCVAGLALRGDPHEAQKAVTVEAGDNWLLQVHKDDEKAPCVELVDQKGVLIAGQCAYATVVDPDDPTATLQYKATSAKVSGQVVIFGPVPLGVASVELTLADDSHPTSRTGEKNGVHYFVYTADVADKGPTTLLDARGKRIAPPQS